MYVVLKENEYSHIANTYAYQYQSENKITESKDKYYLFTRLDVIPDGELDTYVSNEDVYKSIE